MLKFLLDNWYLVLMAIVSGGLLLWTSVQQRGGVGGGAALAVDTTEAVRMINREKALLVDVSEAADYAAGHAGGARHAPLSALDNAAAVKALPTNKALPLLVTGARGVNLNRAAGMLRQAGYQSVRTVMGGTEGWRAAGLPVERSA